MAKTGKSLAGWTQTRNTIWENWHINHTLRRGLDFSDDPDSDYQKYTRNMEALEADSIRHFDTGMKIVNENAATGDVVTRLKAASEEAKQETAKIVNATEKLRKATEVVDLVTRVVAGFAAVVV